MSPFGCVNRCTTPRPSPMPGLILIAALLAVFWFGVGISLGFWWAQS
jgi:hypothetical protein